MNDPLLDELKVAVKDWSAAREHNLSQATKAMNDSNLELTFSHFSQALQLTFCISVIKSIIDKHSK